MWHDLAQKQDFCYKMSLWGFGLIAQFIIFWGNSPVGDYLSTLGMGID
jgi:hypothetical protein